MMKNNTNKGFTLIELLVVISIIGMLASVVLASLSGARAKGVVAAGQTFDSHVRQAFGADAFAVFNFDDQVIPPTDTSGNGITMTCSGTPTNVPGIIGSGMNFPSTAYCYSGNPLPLYNISDPTSGSISFWIQPASYVNNYIAFAQSVIIQEGVNGKISVGYTVDGSAFTFNALISNTPIVLNQWNHVLITFGSGSARIYINGVLDNSLVTSNIVFRSDKIRFGFPLSKTVPSTLDQFAVYTQSMQTAQVEKLYASELPRHMLAKVGK